MRIKIKKIRGFSSMYGRASSLQLCPVERSSAGPFFALPTTAKQFQNHPTRVTAMIPIMAAGISRRCSTSFRREPEYLPCPKNDYCQIPRRMSRIGASLSMMRRAFMAFCMRWSTVFVVTPSFSAIWA